MVVYLHGGGGGGASAEQIRKLLQPLMNQPFVLLVPLCPPVPDGMNKMHQTWNHQILGALIKSVINEYRIDSARCSLMGFSMGGSASWELPYYHPELFDKVAVMSGSCHFWKVRYFPKIPVWVFSGGAEQWLPYHKQTVDAAKSFGVNVTYTIWPGLGHGENHKKSLNYEPLVQWLSGELSAPKQP